MARATVAWMSLICLAGNLSAHEVTLTVVSKDKVPMSNAYKVVVKGTTKLKLGEDYLSTDGFFYNQDLDYELSVNWVSITPPQKQQDGTWKDGSFEYWYNIVTHGSWLAGGSMLYVNTEGKQGVVINSTPFTIP